ncbi:Spy0128 family protein, partial [Streptococcus infantis]|uniref:Spy0128 family protein n=1 Tax=Streptococcus infantis TaxID=68892 RepID=UPI0039C0FB2B
LKDSTGKVVETVKNDAAGNVKFSAIEFKKEQEGVHNYTVEEVAGTDATVTYDTMKANVTVTVSHDGTAKVLVATVGDIADKESNPLLISSLSAFSASSFSFSACLKWTSEPPKSPMAYCIP